jgi:phage tail P2-like protein
MSSLLRNTNLIDFCAPSFSYDRQVQSACKAFDEQMHEIIDVTDGYETSQIGEGAAYKRLSEIIFIPLILDLADETLVDILAWQFHVDFYDRTKSLEFRKQLVWNSIQWHMRKGTVQLVQDVLDMFWPGGASLLEWYEYMSPLPPNYPNDNPDTQLYSLAPSAVNITTNTFTITGHVLVNNDSIRFTTIADALAPQLPEPLQEGFWYRVINKTANTFQVAHSLGAPAIDLTTQGSGTNYLWRRGTGSWHDRYRFRILIDETIIQPEDYEQVIALINAYKPVSRWLEGIFRMRTSECDIGWAGMMLRFIYRESDAPDFVFEAHGYEMIGPSSGAPSSASAPFTVQLRVGATLDAPVTITPSDHGAGGTFTPASVTLTTIVRSAQFTYTPASSGSKVIDVTNDGDLDDPPSITLVASNDGAAIHPWLDSSGNGHDANQPVVSQRGIFRENRLNGKPVIQFSAASQQGYNLATSIPFTAPWTAFMVMKPTATTDGVISLAGDVYHGIGTLWSDGKMYANCSFYSIDGNLQTVDRTQFHVYTVMVINGAVAQFYVDGTLFTNGGTGGYADAYKYLGWCPAAGGMYSNGDIAEIIHFYGAIESDRANVEAGLGAKYGLTVAGGTPVDPSTIANMLGWWKADSIT